ncbi:MAG: NUDIX domain-containing protein [Methylobacteriaceae bacterium]|nr:NUDIX domain-containing protein [Methylobacteriaceae bacterium]
MPKRSAGLLLHRGGLARLEVLLVHPGGPFWARKDEGAWSIPKGELADGEDPYAAALREFAEETGFAPPTAEATDLGEAVQPSRKIVRAFAVADDLDATAVRSNLIDLVWPPRSGHVIQVPEIDRAAWLPLHEAERKLLAGQRVFLHRLAAALA